MKLTREIANVIENYNEMANKMNEYLVREIIYDKNQRKIQSKMLRVFSSTAVTPKLSIGFLPMFMSFAFFI